MKSFEEKLSPGERMLYGDGYFSGDYNQTLVLRRSKEGTQKREEFYLSILSRINGKTIQQGYIYFYLDYQTKTSDFISIKVRPEFRNLNIASFLIASWIDMCMNSGYEILGCIPHQRKPFPLYLLKKYNFEIPDVSLYKKRPDIVYICKSNDYFDKTKFLLFKSPEQEKLFIKSTINYSDNYSIIHNLNGKVVLDRILLPIGRRSPRSGTYQLSEENTLAAEESSQKTIQRHKR